MHTTTRLAGIALLLTILLFGGVFHVAAQTPEAGQGGELKQVTPVETIDPRVAAIKGYLIAHNSPMVEYAEFFVSEADRLGLPWNLVAAIAGTESTFGQHVPPGSYNAWGWGIPTGASSGIGFSSWAAGITSVSEGLRYNYINRGSITVEDIGHIYAASPVWATHVRYFMEKIAAFDPASVQHDTDELSLTL